MVPNVTTILQRFTTEWAALRQPEAILRVTSCHSRKTPQCTRTPCPLCGYHPVWSAFSFCCLARSVDRLRGAHGSAGAWGLRGCLAPAQLV
jgi:hypothetical protein